MWGMVEAFSTVILSDVNLENLLKLPDAVILPIIPPVLPLRLPHCLRLLRVCLDPLFLLLSVLLLELLKLSLKLATLLQLDSYGSLSAQYFMERFSSSMKEDIVLRNEPLGQRDPA